MKWNYLFILCLLIASSSAQAMVVGFSWKPSGVDSEAIDAALDYLVSPWAGPGGEDEDFIGKLKTMSDKLGPAFLNELLKYLEDQTYWENPVDRKDELLAVIPAITESSRFEGFNLNPLRPEIEAALIRLQRFSVHGNESASRREIFARIFAALQSASINKARPAGSTNIVPFNRCEADLTKPK